MHKVIEIAEFQQPECDALEDVIERNSSYVLARDGKPRAAVVPYEDFLRLQELRKQEVLKRFDELQDRLAVISAQYTEEEVAADVEAAVQEVRNAQPGDQA